MFLFAFVRLPFSLFYCVCCKFPFFLSFFCCVICFCVYLIVLLFGFVCCRLFVVDVFGFCFVWCLF